MCRDPQDARPRPAYKRPAAPMGESGAGRPPTRRSSFRPASGRPNSGKPDSANARAAAFVQQRAAFVPHSNQDSSPRSSHPSNRRPLRSSDRNQAPACAPMVLQRRRDGEICPAAVPTRKASPRDLAHARRKVPARLNLRVRRHAASQEVSAPPLRARSHRSNAALRPEKASHSVQPALADRREASAQADRGASGRPSPGGRPPYRPSSNRPADSGSRPAFGSRPPARSGAGRFTARPEGNRPYKPSGRPPREGASGGDRPFTPRPPRAGGFSSTRPPRAGGYSSARPRTGESRPYSPQPGGRPSGGATGARPGPKRGGSSFKPTGRSAGGPPRSGSRPSQGGKGQGFKPGGTRFKAGTGRPRPASGSKPGGRPPANFKKRPKSGE